MAKIQGKFNWNKPEVYTSFVQGEDALKIYNSLKGAMRNGISYDAETKTLIGSNVFAAARIDSILRPLGIRVANLKDLSRPEVMQMVERKYYTDAPALILRSMKDSCEKNLPLIKQIAELIEEANGRVQLPAMITGFDVKVREDKTGYGIALVPRDDFKAVSYVILVGDANGNKFSKVDELGLPILDELGDRKWYARYEGLSRLCLYRNLNVLSNLEDLAVSGGSGRVVLVSAEGTHENLQKYLSQLQQEANKQKAEINAIIEEGRFRSRSHIPEYSLNKFLREIENGKSL